MIANTWHQGVQFCQSQGKPYVLLTVMGSLGSTPRAQGTKMLVTDDREFDTLGGGQLEFEAIKHARNLLAANDKTQDLQHFPLGAKLAQCCGGATHILYELMNNQVQQIAVFGAGHVAKALIPIISQLPIQLHWVDNRPEQFEGFDLPANVTSHCVEDPVELLSVLTSLSHVVIMTHNHQLDYDIAAKALHIDNLHYIGVIGSETKSRRFKTRLSRRVPELETRQNFHCPIGHPDVQGKLPIEVAVSISAQLVSSLQQHSAFQDDEKSLAKQSWQNTKEIFELL